MRWKPTACTAGKLARLDPADREILQRTLALLADEAQKQD
ncbi:hypothetical protein Lesp01_26490 [Lentzea sp. NBRC 102530]|nr:hypothetical protein Lesp01_26490 [Lentzea sp. NBRC 102530]